MFDIAWRRALFHTEGLTSVKIYTPHSQPVMVFSQSLLLYIFSYVDFLSQFKSFSALD